MIVEQLEYACKLSGAAWAAWLYANRNGSLSGNGASTATEWKLEYSARLSREGQAALQAFLATPDHSAWLAGSASTGRMRTRPTGKASASLGCPKLFAFGRSGQKFVLLVGGEGLGPEMLEYFRLLTFRAPERESARSPADDSIQHIFFDLARAVSSGRETGEAAALVVDTLCRFFETENAAVFLLDENQTILREYTGFSQPDPLIVPVDGSLCGLVVENGRPLRIGDTANDPRNFGQPDGMRAFLAAPMRYHDLLVGVIMLESSQPDCFTQSDEDFLSVISGQLAGMFVNVNSFSEIRRWANSLELIHQVVQRIVGLTDEAEIAQVTAELMASFFGYELTAVLTPDESGLLLINLGIGGPKAGLFQRFSTFSASDGIIGQVFQSGRSYFSNDVTEDPYYFGVGGWQAGSEICIPLASNGRVIGVINLERLQKGSFSKQDQLAAESLAGIVSSVVMSARRHRQLQIHLNQLRAVRDTTLDIIGNLDLDRLLKRVVHRARLLIDAPGAEIGLVEEDRQGVRVQTSENPWYEFSGHLIPIGQGIAGQVLLTGAPVVVSDYNSWGSRLWPGTHVDFKAAAGIPLRFHEQVIGTLVVMDDSAGRVFNSDDIEILELLAQNIAIAIRNARLFEELAERIETQRIMEARLVQSEKLTAAGRLTASIAHEINNPLQAVQNALYLADRQELSAEQRQKYLVLARSELDRLASTVQRMLEYYRPGAKDRQRTHINELVQRVLDLVQPQLERKKIQLVTRLSPELPEIFVVAHQIQQVLINLILNAMDAMPDGGRLTVTTRMSETTNPAGRKSRKQIQPRSLEISIHDTGVGVMSAERERIFEPFVSTKENGTGLGLSVSYNIIQAHGGLLSLVEDHTPGACFRITLPEETKT